MEPEPENRSLFKRFVAATDHPVFNIAVIGWGLFLGLVWATVRNDVFLLAKAGETIALALARLLIQRHHKWFFRGILATAIAIPVATYTTTPIFWHRWLPVTSSDFLEFFAIGILCSIPFFFIAIWGLRFRSESATPDRPDPSWFKTLNQLFKWALAVMVLSFHIANPPLVIAGILIFLAGITCLAAVRLNLTIRHVGNFLLIVGSGVVLVSLILIPLFDGRVSPGEAAFAIIPGAALAILGFFLRIGKK